MPEPKLPNIEPGISLCCQVDPDVSDDFLTFLNQIGVHHAYAWFKPEQYNYEFLSRFRDRLNGRGVALYNAGAVHLAKSRKIILGLDGRDEDVQAFSEALTMLAKVGVHTTTFTWEPDGVWASDWEYPTRGGALTRRCDISVLEGRELLPEKRYTQIPINNAEFNLTGFTQGRFYTRDELWRNYEYFVKRVLPVAEERGVRLALHPNDPPVESVGGVPCLIRNFDDFRRAFSVVESDFLGMEFCCGCWLETPETFGDVYRAIEEFARRKKIFLVHYRNVDAALPCFVETFIDEGYGDMPALMRAFLDSGYSGTLVMDHSPAMAGPAGRYGEAGFAYGYIRAVLQDALRAASDGGRDRP
ncbi:MAG: mannonate dehydratase [Synergistaceae bacterium]|nr:mannonate dehydratase [Synergistaceae bacterium]